MLSNEIFNLRLQPEDGRKHHFDHTSEQRRLLNIRSINKPAMDKSEYDGSSNDKDNDKSNGNEADNNISFDNVSVQNNKPSRKKETVPCTGKTRLKVEKVVVYEMEEYDTLPEERRFMNCNGMPNVWEYRVIEHVRGHNVEHVYKAVKVNLQTVLSQVP